MCGDICSKSANNTNGRHLAEASLLCCVIYMMCSFSDFIHILVVLFKYALVIFCLPTNISITVVQYCNILRGNVRYNMAMTHMTLQSPSYETIDIHLK